MEGGAGNVEPSRRVDGKLPVDKKLVTFTLQHWNTEEMEIFEKGVYAVTKWEFLVVWEEFVKDVIGRNDYSGWGLKNAGQLRGRTYRSVEMAPIFLNIKNNFSPNSGQEDASRTKFESINRPFCSTHSKA